MNEAFFFDGETAGSGDLFGTCTYSNNRDAANIGILFCHAFSEERQRSYRSTFLFAQQLAKAGFPSLRFDYKGTGDSQGLLVDTTLESMVNNTISAYSEAKSRLGVRKLVVIGIRLGCVIAVKTSAQLAGLEHLVLWNPVFDGKRYYRDLMRTEAMINLARKSTTDPDSTAKKGFVEVDSDLMSPEMVAQLNTVNLAAEEHCVPNYYVSGCANDKIENRQIEQLVQKLDASPTSITCWTGESGEFWTSRSMYDAFYPTKTFKQTLEWLGEIRGD